MKRQMALQEGANRWLHSESESESAQLPERKENCLDRSNLRFACTRMIGRKAWRKETT